MSEKKQPHASFTLIEMLAAVVIVAILASVAVVGYQGYQDRAAMLQDETNMMILQVAVKINAIQTGTVAGSISDLRHVDLEKAYAMVSVGKRPYTLLAYATESWRTVLGESVAEAADSFLPPEYYHKDLKVITCPNDPHPPTGFDSTTGKPNRCSYAIHKKFRRRSIGNLQWPLNRNRVLIYEAEGENSEVYRHRGGHQAVRVTVSGKTIHRKDSDDNDDPPDVE